MAKELFVRRIFLFLVLGALVLTPMGATLSLAQEVMFTNDEILAVAFDDANMRSEPSTNSEIVSTLNAGDEVRVVDDAPVQADNLIWWNVSDDSLGVSGWMVEESLTPAASFVAQPGDSADCWTDEQRSNVEGIPQWDSPPANTIVPMVDYTASIVTDKGDIVIALDAEHAPLATNNFICLARAGYYDGTDFHRIAADFLIQGGDPTGSGVGSPGYTIPSDSTTGSYPEGSIALANTGPDQNGAQFFIAAADLTGLIPADYPVFGQVTSGFEVVRRISREPTIENAQGELTLPESPTIIASITIVDPTASADTSSIQDSEATSSGAILSARDLAFEPTTVTVPASGEPVIITMTNDGAATHNFSIDELGIDVDAQPGETVEIEIPAGTAPGIYAFYCKMTGHKAAGMRGELVVGQSDDIASRGDCVGLGAYQAAFKFAYLVTAENNPEGAALLAELGSALIGASGSMEDLTSTDLLAVSAFLADVANALELVIAPEFAREWHQLQIDTYRLLGEFLASMSANGQEYATEEFAPRIAALRLMTDEGSHLGTGCPVFELWAAEVGVSLL
jgi:cyclophilin family peptidyl-prolyl cis-trans isomerase